METDRVCRSVGQPTFDGTEEICFDMHPGG
jgi:hypothetical protein